jgi:DNA-binding CsgD family transcriptional regulator
VNTNNVAIRNASARWQVNRRKLIAQGKWEPFVDAEPVREHLRKVNAAGMPYMAISRRLGLAQESSLQHLMWGRGEYGPGQQVRRETAEVVLAYWPSLDDFPDAARIDATGTRRRVQALAVRGWPRRLMAERVGMVEKNFGKAIARERVTARVARRVAAMYDELWNQDPLEHGVPLWSVARVQGDAARSGFHSALAWDDDTIDDPKAVPITDALEPVVTEGGNVAQRWLLGESVILGRDDRREVLQHLFEWTNDTTAEIAAKLDMTPDAAERAWERIKEKAQADGRRVWRRVYVPRERTLNQNEMEEVA